MTQITERCGAGNWSRRSYPSHPSTFFGGLAQLPAGMWEFFTTAGAGGSG